MTPQELRELVFNFRTSRIILTALELDIFSAIGNESKTSTDISKIISSDARSTDRLMNVLCNMDLLKKENGKFSNTKFSARYLVKSSPDYISNLLHSSNLWNSWSNLTEIVKTGKPQRRDSAKNNWVENFIEAMHYRALQQAPEDISSLDLSGVKNVLDLGGGSGAFSMQFIKQKRDIIATIFDLPDVIPLTLKYISANGFEGKINTIKGNYLYDDIGSGYDLIFLSAIIHSNSFEENKRLIKKCADALNANGQIVIQDYVMDKDRLTPKVGALFAINMLVNTKGGDTFTQEEIYSWLRDAGINDIKRNETIHVAAQIIGKKV
jgi:2-polyprenyl-3-methyl-5-hydroxy-6-metoxy-1,4-benzoquinol methylase